MCIVINVNLFFYKFILNILADPLISTSVPEKVHVKNNYLMTVNWHTPGPSASGHQYFSAKAHQIQVNHRFLWPIDFNIMSHTTSMQYGRPLSTEWMFLTGPVFLHLRVLGPTYVIYRLIKKNAKASFV